MKDKFDNTVKMFELRVSNQTIQDNKLLESIVKPIQDALDIKFFHFARVSKNARFISFSTRPDLTDKVFQSLQSTGEPLYLTNLKEGVYLWCENPLFQTAIDVMSEAQIGNGISFIKHHSDYKEVFAFAGDKDSFAFKESIINNINVLESFCTYFLGRAKELIEKAENRNIKLPSSLNYKSNPVNEDVKKEVSVKLPTSSFYVNNECGYISLSQQESRCLKLWLLGYTNAQISVMLNTSKNAVNSYLQRVKDKLGCQSRGELIKLSREMKLIDFPLLDFLS